MGWKRQAEDLERSLVDQIHIELRDAGLACAAVERVLENALDDGEGGARNVNGNRGLLVIVEGANVVEAEDVVGVTVRVDDGVEAVDAARGAPGRGSRAWCR